MKESTRSSGSHYATAVVLPAVATVIALLLGESIEPSGPEIMIAAVMLAAWYGGLGPGLVATALSVLAIDQFLMPPAYGSVIGWDDIVRLLVFVLVSVLISWLNGARRRARETLQQSHDELEARVHQRTAELATANAILEDQIAERIQAENALRDSEELHRITLSNISDAIFVTDNAGAFTYICPGVDQIFGRSRQEVAKIGNIAGLLGDDLFDRDELDLACEISNIEREIVDATGILRLLLINVKRVSIRGGNELYCCREITDRRRLEEQRMQLERQQAANRAKDECLAMVSHDLRTPLNSVLGWVQLIRKRGSEESLLSQGLEAIEQSARSQHQLLADLLDVSSMNAGNLRLDLRPIDLVAVAQTAIEMVRLDADQRSIDIRLRSSPIVGRVSGDEERLKQVVWNLLVNALKFTPPWGFVEVRLSQTQSTARIVVEDTGCGIDSESLPFVFDSYYRATSATGTGGLGLGLSIARRLVELHGGTIEAQSAGPGKGATFTISLPATSVAVDEDWPDQELSRLTEY